LVRAAKDSLPRAKPLSAADKESSRSFWSRHVLQTKYGPGSGQPVDRP
jgi:hypothetical protein